MDPGIAALFSAIITAVVTLIVEVGAKNRAVNEVKNSFVLPVQVPNLDKRNSIILIGIGGTGKT